MWSKLAWSRPFHHRYSGEHVRLRAPLVAATLITGTLAALPAALSTSPARAGTADLFAQPAAISIALPVTSYPGLLVDSVHDHLFFSQGSASSILVTDYSGSTVATISGQTGVNGMTLSPDGTTLYAALGGADAVSAISTSTLLPTGQVYELPAGDSPHGVAVQSGKLWVSYQTGTAGDAGIGDFDLSAADPSFETQSAMGGWSFAPGIAADPSDTGNVLMAADGLDPSTVASYDTSQDPVTVRAEKMLTSGSDYCSGVGDLTVLPGGAEFMAACDGATVYSTADLSEQGNYPTTGDADAVAAASGSELVTVGGDYGPIEVFGQGDSTATGEFSTSSEAGAAGAPQLLSGGLGMTPDGTLVFAVLAGSNGYALNVYNNGVLLGLNGPATATAGQPVTLNGTLNIGGLAAPAGEPVTISRTGPGATLTASTVTGAGGSFSITDTPPTSGKYSYTAHYADRPIGVFTAMSVVSISARPTTLTLAAAPGNAGYEATLHVTAHLGTTHTNRDVSVYAEPVGGKTKTLLGTRAVNSAGNLTITYKATHSTTFTAGFAGDAWYAGKTVTVTDGVHANVAPRITGYYGSKKAGSTTYRLYHHTAHLNVAATVAPGKAGECVKVEVQEFYKGAWHASALSGCHALNKSSAYAGYLSLAHDARNYPYRMRVDYVAGKDTGNLSTDSSWLYFLVEK
jgi:hypothetical protein